MRIHELHEDASNYTGSANIAGNPSPSLAPMQRRRDATTNRNGDHDWHQAIKDERENGSQAMTPELAARQQSNLKSAKAKVAKQRTFFGRLKGFLEQKQRGGNFRISESFDMQDVMSRLSGLEADGRGGEATVSFGIEDDDGNLMKVTVRSDQAEEFEEALSTELADAARRKEVTGEKTSISMAELLLKLNDEFDIVDASFPTIPTDGVYNADKVQYGVADTGQEELGGGDDLGAFPDDMGGDPMAGGAEGGMEGGMGGDPMAGGAEGGMEGDPMGGGAEGGDPMAGGAEGDMEGDMGGDPMAGGAEGDMEGDPMGGDEEFTDDGSVEDFPEEMEAPANPEQNTLTAILDMLKAEAETRKAEADARAEEARAKQAEFTAMATKNAVAQEEEVARMQAEIEARKGKEKDAKRISDLARYRVSTASGIGEGVKPTFGQFLTVINEIEEFDTVQTLTRQRSMIRMKYATAPGDDPDTIRYKREAMQNANRELDAKLRQAQSAARYKDAAARTEKTLGKEAQQSMTPQQQQQAKMQAAQQGAAGTPNAL